MTYIATATAGDEEMAARIKRHRTDRPAGWTTVEEPNDLVGAVARIGGDEAILIDLPGFDQASRDALVERAATVLRPAGAFRAIGSVPVPVLSALHLPGSEPRSMRPLGGLAPSRRWRACA